MTEAGELVDQRVATTRERLATLFAERKPMRILLEASTESEWVAQHLETFGHQVVVADPNYVPMYGHRTRRVKTDLRDVAALTDACMQGNYRPAHRRSERQRAVQRELNVREELVETRTRSILLARAMTRADGLRLRSGVSETFVRRLNTLDLPPATATALAPLCRVIDLLNEELAAADARFAAAAKADPEVRRLMTLPGVGPITATAFMAALDDTSRFHSPGQVTSYLGLDRPSTARERNDGEVACCEARIRGSRHYWCRQVGASGGRAARRPRGCDDGPRRSAGAAARRWRSVALARRLARILFAMWRDETMFTGRRIRAGRAPSDRPVSRATARIA